MDIVNFRIEIVAWASTKAIGYTKNLYLKKNNTTAKRIFVMYKVWLPVLLKRKIFY